MIPVMPSQHQQQQQDHDAQSNNDAFPVSPFDASALWMLYSILTAMKLNRLHCGIGAIVGILRK